MKVQSRLTSLESGIPKGIFRTLPYTVTLPWMAAARRAYIAFAEDRQGGQPPAPASCSPGLGLSSLAVLPPPPPPDRSTPLSRCPMYPCAH